MIAVIILWLMFVFASAVMVLEWILERRSNAATDAM